MCVCGVCVGGGWGGRNMCSLWEGLGENTAIMSSGGVSLAGAAAGILLSQLFVACHCVTKLCFAYFSCDKKLLLFVTTKNDTCDSSHQ